MPGPLKRLAVARGCCYAVRVSINVPEGSEPTAQGSSDAALGVGVTALGVVAVVVLITALFLPVASIDVANGSCEVIHDANPALADRCSLSILERRGTFQGVLWGSLLGAAIIIMALGAGLGRSRPAAVALVVLGAVLLFFGLVVDLPETNKTGAIGRSFEGATATKGPALYAELLAGALAMIAGAIRLLNPR